MTLPGHRMLEGIGWAQVRAVFDSTPMRIALLDRDRRYLYANPEYVSFAGKLIEAILGRTVPEVLEEETFAPFYLQLHIRVLPEPSRSDRASARQPRERPRSRGLVENNCVGPIGLRRPGQDAAGHVEEHIGGIERLAVILASLATAPAVEGLAAERATGTPPGAAARPVGMAIGMLPARRAIKDSPRIAATPPVSCRAARRRGESYGPTSEAARLVQFPCRRVPRAAVSTS